MRFALRRLARSPMFTAVSLATLAIGIGANTAMFSVINGVLLKPLPYPHAEQLVALWHSAPGINISELNMAPSLYFTYADENRVFQDVGMWTTSTSSVTGLAEPEEVPLLSVTNRFFPMLEVQPALGRGFTVADDDPKSERIVMLSDAYWKARFGGDRGVLGRRILVDGIPRAVVGVLPASFAFLDRKITLVVPLRFKRAEVQLINFSYQGIARLKPGVTLQEASADIARMVPMAPAKFPDHPAFTMRMFESARIGPNLRFLKDHLLGNIGNTLWVLMGTVGIVLLIACANVANLLLVRADGRRQELAIRAALGAGWGRIARELLVESLSLGLVGGALGLALAWAALRLLTASDIARLPRLGDISIDPLVLAYTLAISLAAGLVFGLIPVFKYARPQLSNALRGGGRTLSQSRERHRARSVLVIVQVALAMVLLVSSGLMIRTFQALRRVDPGFSRAHELQLVRIAIPESQVQEPARVLRMQQAILDRLAALPGVTAAAFADVVPMDGRDSNDPVYAEDHVYREGTIPPIHRLKFISPGYTATMGGRLIAGREFNWSDTYNQTPVALVSENAARGMWQNARAAIGKRIRAGLKDEWYEVIGVLADERSDGVDRPAPPTIYWPLMPRKFQGRTVRVNRSVAFLLRTARAGSTALQPELRQAVWSVNPNLPLADVNTLGAMYDRSLARTSFTLLMLAIAGGMALLLGVVGIYGVIAYSVSQRTREIGIRLALGAPQPEVTRMFVRHGLRLSAAGALIGLAAALVLTRLMKALLFDVSSADPVTYLAVSAGLIFCAMLASYLPARRAASVDSACALRAE